MASILILSGSPSPTAPPAVFADYARARLAERGHAVRLISVRDLPTAALLSAGAAHPILADTITAAAGADALLVVTPVTRASTSGLLRALVDLLRPVDVPALPVATGTFAAHARVLDHAIRPALGPRALPTLFLPEHQAVLAPLHAALDAVTAAIPTPVRAAG